MPARRYRDWAVENFKPVPIGQQKPEWVRDTRVMVITGLDLKQLPVLQNGSIRSRPYSTYRVGERQATTGITQPTTNRSTVSGPS